MNIFNNEILQPDGSLIVCGTAKLVVPAGGNYVRQTDLKLPFFEITPTISVQMFSLERNGFAEIFNSRVEAFPVYDIKFHEEQTYLGCKISATNIWNAEKSDRSYVCNYIVHGQPKVTA